MVPGLTKMFPGDGSFLYHIDNQGITKQDTKKRFAGEKLVIFIVVFILDLK